VGPYARTVDASAIVDHLLGSDEPSVRWKVRVGVLGEARYYRGTDGLKRHDEHVGWGGVDKRRTNEWVTADALAVLAAAGRLD
jgi:hypothetical protein